MNLRTLLMLVVISGAPTVARAHGLQMTFHVNAGGNFESDSPAYYSPIVDPVDHHDSVFLPGSYTVNSVTTQSLQFTASPATTNPPASNGIADLSTWGFDLSGPLVFWDPILGDTPTAVTATVVRSGTAFTIDQNTTFVTGGNLATTAAPYHVATGTGFHNSTTVNIPLGSPVGLYAIGYDIRSTNSTPYGTSNRFYAIGTNGLSDTDFYRGIEALSAIGVPEPSSLILLALGACGVAFHGWHRRKLSRRG